MSGSDGNGTPGAGRLMLNGAIWMIALRWAMRLTGVVSTIILARLLTPKDFGVVAIAMVVIGLFEMLSATGQGLAIIRHRNPAREHYDTAWTISVLIGIGLAIIIFATAPLSQFYFHDERAVPVIQCLSLRPLLSGFENIGTVNFRKDLKFGRVFSYNYYAKLLSFTLTITLAVALRNYWALVAGILSGQLARTVLSYLMHPHRPRFTLSKRAEIWSFSIWTLLREIGDYFVRQVDILAIGGVAGATLMGRYTVAKDIASSPTDEINTPMVSVLFPVMVRYQDDPNQLRHLYLRTLGWSAIIGTSTALGVLMVAPDMVPLVLGSKWLDITPLMGWFAMTIGLLTLTYPSFILLDTLGLPHIGARMQWVRVVLLTAAIFPAAYITHNLMEVAAVRFIMTLLFVPALLLAVSRYTMVSVRDYISTLWRPLVAGGTMVLALWALNDALTFSGPARLAIDIAAGALTYGAALLALWAMGGRPPTAERDLIGMLESMRLKLRAIRGRRLGTAQ